MEPLLQVVSLAGAAVLLSAYFAYQRGWLDRRNRLYSALNLIGSLLLAWVAIEDQRWGFIVLEVVWALVSIPPLFRPPAPAAT